MNRTLATITLPAVVAACLAHAITPLGDEYLVAQQTAGPIDTPSANRAVAHFDDGGFVISWERGSNVMTRRFDATGAPPEPEFVVCEGAGYPYDYEACINPAVMTRATGGFVVSHALDGDYVSDYILLGEYDKDANQVGTREVLESWDSGSGSELGRGGDGEYLVVWGSGAQRFDREDQPLTGVVASPTGAGRVGATNAAGEQVVVVTASSSSSVLAQWFSQNGETDGVIQVNQHAATGSVTADVAMDPTGAFVVTWSSEGGDGSGMGIRARRFAAGGVPLGDEWVVNQVTTNHQRQPAVAVDSLGNAVFVWESYLEDGSGWGVFGRECSRFGGLGDAFQVNQETTLDQDSSSVSLHDDGTVVVVWRSTGGSKSARVRRFMTTLPFFADAFETGDTGAWSAAVP